MIDACVCCGAYVPEGRMICPQCEAKSNEGNEDDEGSTKVYSVD